MDPRLPTRQQAPFLLLLLSLTLAAGSLTAAAVDLSQLPATERWLVQVDGTAFLASQLGHWLEDQSHAPTIAARIALLTSVTGIDPARDLASMTISGVDADNDGPLVYVRGHFDPVRLTTLAQAAPGYAVTTYGAHTIAHWIDHRDPAVERTAYATIIGDHLVIFARRLDRLEGALEVIDGHAPGADKAGHIDPARFPPGSPLILVAGVDMPAWHDLAPKAEILRQAKDVVISISESGADLVATASVTGVDPAVAPRIHDLLLGLAALARLSGHQDRFGAAGNSVLDSLHVAVDGAIVTASAQCPEAAILDLIAHPHPGPTPVGAAPAAAAAP